MANVAGTVRNQTAILATNKVLKNTYTLLALTLAFSAVTAFAAMATNARPVNWLVMMGVFIGFPFIIGAVRNSVWSLPLTFVFTGLMGWFMGPIVALYLNLANGPTIVFGALVTTAVAFFALSGYALVSRKDFSFMRGFIFAGLIVVIAAIVLNIFWLQLPALSLAISTAAVLLMSALILYDTSRMVHDGQTNYVLMTVSLFANIYVMFSHLLNLFAVLGGED